MFNVQLERERAVALLGVAEPLGDGDEAVVLQAQVARDVGVDVLDQRLERHRRCGFLNVDLAVDLVEELGLDARALPRRDDVAREQMTLHAIERVARAHGGQLRLVPIDRGFGVELELGRRDPSQPGTTE